MPVRLAANEETEAVELLTGGEVARLTTSNPPVTAVVPEFCRLVTTAIARFGSTAIAVGGPLNATVVPTGAACTWPKLVAVFVGSLGNNTVRSIDESVLEPLFATSASA